MPALLLAAALGAACAAVEVETGSRVLVRLYDGRTGALLELANASNPDWRDVYDHPLPDARLKRAPDELVSELLAGLQDEGFFERAVAGPPPEGAVEGWLAVRCNGDERTLAVPDGARDRDLLAAFARMKLLVGEAYSSVAGLQLIENPRGRDYFEDAR